VLAIRKDWVVSNPRNHWATANRLTVRLGEIKPRVAICRHSLRCRQLSFELLRLPEGQCPATHVRRSALAPALPVASRIISRWLDVCILPWFYSMLGADWGVPRTLQPDVTASLSWLGTNLSREKEVDKKGCPHKLEPKGSVERAHDVRTSSFWESRSARVAWAPALRIYFALYFLCSPSTQLATQWQPVTFLRGFRTSHWLVWPASERCRTISLVNPAPRTYLTEHVDTHALHHCQAPTLIAPEQDEIGTALRQHPSPHVRDLSQWSWIALF